MQDRQKIERLIAEGQLNEAISILDHKIEHAPDNAMWWYLRGRAYWKLDQRGSAISDFEEAVHLDPNSDARHALELSRDVMDYYNKDLLNP